MKPVVTLIVIADGEHARFFLHDRPGGHLKPAVSPDFTEKHKPSRQLGEAKPGRSYASTGSARSAMENHSDPHDQAEANFAVHLASALDLLAKAEGADRMILAAAPKILGVLRKAMTPQTEKMIIATLHKDLVKTPVHDLAAHFKEHLPV